MDCGKSNRALKVGIAYEVEKKMEDNYDREEAAGTPGHVLNWVHALTKGDHEECKGCDWKSINMHLRDGVALCKLINKLLKEDGKAPITFQKKVMSPFVAMTNIENFNKGCKDYGLPEESTFQSGDLWEVRKGMFLNVINAVHSLGFLANSKGCKDKYLGNLQKQTDE